MWSTDSIQFKVLISVMMVVTGSINTLSVKYVYLAQKDQFDSNYLLDTF